MITQKMKKNTLIYLGLLLTLLAVVTRFYMLPEKPIHFDEGINGWFSMQMREMGFYRYDPANYHGPLYFYLLNWSEWFFGQSLTVLRLVPTIFGVGAIGVFVLAAFQLSSAYLLIGVMVLLSPAFVFFSRSGIHEMPFVFFQLVFALGLVGWMKAQSQKGLMVILTGLWGMILLKETFAVTLMACAAAAVLMGPGFVKKNLSWSVVKASLDRNFLKFFLGLFVLFLLFFTGFLRNPNGFLDFFRAFMPWLKTGTHGNGHEKEFLYWAKVMWEAEPLALFGLVLSVWGCLQKKYQDLRFWSLFGLIQFLIYSLIPYKTVWCLVSIVWPFFFVIFYSVEVSRSLSKKCFMGAISFGILISACGLPSLYRSSYRHPIDFEHPYVYVNSTYGAKEIQDYLEDQVKSRPQVKTQLIQVGMPEQWPWPWILRNYEHLSYQTCAKEILADAAVYFCETPESEYVERSFQEPYWKITTILRQTRNPSVIYFKKSIFPDPPSPTATLLGQLEAP